MGAIHNELNTVNNKNSVNHNFNQYDYEKAFKLFSYFKNNYLSIIPNLFYGMDNLIMKCLNFDILRHNIQCYNILIFALEEVKKFKNRIQISLILNALNIIKKKTL